MKFIELTLSDTVKTKTVVNAANVAQLTRLNNYTMVTFNFGMPTTNGGTAYTIGINETPEQFYALLKQGN
jgi:hypothetical protein